MSRPVKIASSNGYPRDFKISISLIFPPSSKLNLMIDMSDNA